MKHLFKGTLGAMAIAATALAFTATSASAELRRVTIGTNPQGTLYFVVGGGLGKLFSDKLGINATAQPYAGSSVYLPLIQSGEVTLGFSSSLDTNLAYNGLDVYGTPQDKLRSFARSWPLPYAFFARADSGMTEVADLKGKKVAVTFAANAALDAANRAMLAAAGLDPDTDVDSVTITGIPEGYNLVTEGGVAAAATALAIPLARQADSTIPGGIIMLAVKGENATTEFLNSQVPGLYMRTTMPSDNNPGVKEETPITGFDVYLVGSADMSDDDAYMLIKTIHENWEALQTDYPVLRQNPADGLIGTTNTAPFHPGVVRYFKEIGLWTDENDARDAALMK